MIKVSSHSLVEACSKTEVMKINKSKKFLTFTSLCAEIYPRSPTWVFLAKFGHAEIFRKPRIQSKKFVCSGAGCAKNTRVWAWIRKNYITIRDRYANFKHREDITKYPSQEIVTTQKTGEYPILLVFCQKFLTQKLGRGIFRSKSKQFWEEWFLF